jgi:hypothetical protein
MISIDEGLQIDSSDEQYSNANSPTCRIMQTSSNPNVPRRLQQLKQELGIALSDEGIQID